MRHIKITEKMKHSIFNFWDPVPEGIGILTPNWHCQKHASQVFETLIFRQGICVILSGLKILVCETIALLAPERQNRQFCGVSGPTWMVSRESSKMAQTDAGVTSIEIFPHLAVWNSEPQISSKSIHFIKILSIGFAAQESTLCCTGKHLCGFCCTGKHPVLHRQALVWVLLHRKAPCAAQASTCVGFEALDLHRGWSTGTHTTKVWQILHDLGFLILKTWHDQDFLILKFSHDQDFLILKIWHDQDFLILKF